MLMKDVMIVRSWMDGHVCEVQVVMCVVMEFIKVLKYVMMVIPGRVMGAVTTV